MWPFKKKKIEGVDLDLINDFSHFRKWKNGPGKDLIEIKWIPECGVYLAVVWVKMVEDYSRTEVSLYQRNEKVYLGCLNNVDKVKEIICKLPCPVEIIGDFLI